MWRKSWTLLAIWSLYPTWFFIACILLPKKMQWEVCLPVMVLSFIMGQGSLWHLLFACLSSVTRANSLSFHLVFKSSCNKLQSVFFQFLEYLIQAGHSLGSRVHCCPTVWWRNWENICKYTCTYFSWEPSCLVSFIPQWFISSECEPKNRDWIYLYIVWNHCWHSMCYFFMNTKNYIPIFDGS